MKCENCKFEISEAYGSGRFCSSKCAKSFATKSKRKEINQKVSKSLKGRRSWSSSSFKKGFDKRRLLSKTEEAKEKFRRTSRRKRQETYKSLDWNNLPFNEKRRRIYKKQNGKCSGLSNIGCKISNNWNSLPIILEIDHINGDSSDNREENLRFLCPNCHSQTNTFRTRSKSIHESYKKFIFEISDIGDR